MSFRSAAFALFAVSLLAGPAAGQTAPVRVALTGTPAPAGGNYSFFHYSPTLGPAGQVGFQADLTGGTARNGLFAGTPGAVGAVAIQGLPAPAGGNYGGFGSPWPYYPLFTEAGQVGFTTNLVDGPATHGIFLGPLGALQPVAISGTPAPGGGNYGWISSPSLSGTGHLGFQADVTGGPSPKGIFAGAPGAIRAAAYEGLPAPAGGNYLFFISGPKLNGAGQVVFKARLSSAEDGIFAGAPGAVQAVAITGTPAPGGGNYDDFTLDSGNPAINGAGQVAFRARLAGGTATRGIFVGTPGAVEAVALQGTPAPAGGNYGTFGAPSLNTAGQVAFQSNLAGGTATNGIFIWTPDAVQTVALQGVPAPGGGSFTGLGTPVLNETGQLAFTAGLAGPGVTTNNDTGLYAGTVGGLVKIVREGDVIDVDLGPGIDNRTVSSIAFAKFGEGVGFNDAGLLAYRLNFTDGSSGIFTSSITPVPEPAGLLAAAAAGLAGWRLRRRVTA